MKYFHDVSDIRNIGRWLSNHRCSDCWENLVHDQDSQTVTCVTEGCECNGIVHINTILARELESRDLLRQAQRNLHKHGYQVPGYDPEKHTQAAILSDLGF